MHALSERAANALTPGTEVDFHKVTTALTLEVAVQTMFGQSSNVDAAVVGKHLDAVMARFEAIGYLLEPYWWPSPSQVRCRRALVALDRIVAQYIEVRRAAPGDDVLSMLLATRDENGAAMSPKQLRDEVMTLFIAGQETTALALVFSWRLLALHQDVALALRREVEQVPRIDLETLPQLTLLDQVIKETLRLHPPAYGIPREALGPDELGGFPIAKGAQVVIALSAMHRDPRYFPDPDAFRPERWTKEFEATLPRCGYLPFGAGPRMCIGAAFADLETKMALATFIRRFRPRLVSDGPIELISSLTQRPRYGLPALLEAWA
jgi:cytochrome P450